MSQDLSWNAWAKGLGCIWKIFRRYGKILAAPLNVKLFFFFYNTWAKFRDPNNLRKITWLFHLRLRLKWVKMDAKFERALKSLNFTDDCIAHPTVEQYLQWLFYILIGLYQNLIKPWKGLLHNLYATHKHLLWQNTQRETCRRPSTRHRNHLETRHFYFPNHPGSRNMALYGLSLHQGNITCL